MLCRDGALHCKGNASFKRRSNLWVALVYTDNPQQREKVVDMHPKNQDALERRWQCSNYCGRREEPICTLMGSVAFSFSITCMIRRCNTFEHRQLRIEDRSIAPSNTVL